MMWNTIISSVRLGLTISTSLFLAAVPLQVDPVSLAIDTSTAVAADDGLNAGDGSGLSGMAQLPEQALANVHSVGPAASQGPNDGDSEDLSGTPQPSQQALDNANAMSSQYAQPFGGSVPGVAQNGFPPQLPTMPTLPTQATSNVAQQPMQFAPPHGGQLGGARP
jgi:hypothetical protein